MTITPEELKKMRACTGFDMPADAQIELLDHIDAQAARIAELEKSESQIISERDSAEDALADMYEAATGERPEWSNFFVYEDAIESVEFYVDNIKKLSAPVAVPDIPSAPEGKYCLSDTEGNAWLAGANWMRDKVLRLNSGSNKK